jgi:hypothetical protein
MHAVVGDEVVAVEILMRRFNWIEARQVLSLRRFTA